MTGIRSSFVLLAVLTGPQPWIGVAAAADTPRQGAIELAADQSGTGASGTGASTEDSLRKRAEDLAGAASERFTQILSDKDKADAKDDAENAVAAAPQDSDDDSVLAPVWDWLAQASKEYQDVIIVKLRDPKSEPVILASPEAAKGETPAAPVVTAQAPAEAPSQAAVQPESEPESQPESDTAAPSEPQAAPSLQWGSITTTIQEWLARANRSYRNEIVKKLRSPQEGPAGEPAPSEPPKAVAEDGAAPQMQEPESAEEQEAPVAQTQTGVDLPVANPKRVAETERKAEAEKVRLADAAEAKRKAEEAEKQRLADEAEAKRKAEEAEAERKRLAEAEAARKAEAEKQRLAEEAEAKRKAEEAEAERKRLAEAEAARKAQAEKQRLAAEAEAKRKAEEAEAERKRLAAAEAARKAEAEKQRLADAAEAKRKAEEAEAERKRVAEAEAARKADAEKQRLAAEAEAKRKAAAAAVERPERKPAPEKAPEKPMEVARAEQSSPAPAAPARESSKLAVNEMDAPEKPEPAPPVAERKPQRMGEAEASAPEARSRPKRHVAKKHHRKRHAAKTYRRKRAHVHAYRKKRYANPRMRHCDCRYRRRCGQRVRHYRSAGGSGNYVVRRGDTLWGIARRHYGNGEGYRRIYRANRGRIRNPHRIYVNQRIYLP